MWRMNASLVFPKRQIKKQSKQTSKINKPNKTNKQAQNLKWESTYRFANSGSKSYIKQDLRLVVGTKEFVQENNAGISLYPDAFVLSQNYPNPFNPQTSIMISLEEDARVDMVIYSLLGEEVVRLASNEFRPAGYYNFIWNGLVPFNIFRYFKLFVFFRKILRKKCFC